MAKKGESYKSLQSELEDILVRLQDSATDIEEAIKLHERGQKLISEMQAYLKQAENKIQVVSAKTKNK